MADIWNTSLITDTENIPFYSINDLTATAIGNGVSYVQNLTPKTTGKWYAELLVTYPNEAKDMYRVGIVDELSPVISEFDARFIGEDIYSLCWTALGNVMHVDYIGFAQEYNSGDTLRIACDFDNNVVWFAVNGGEWTDQSNIDGTADPVTTEGGSNIVSMVGDPKFIAAMLANGSSISIEPLAYMPPAGFTPWLNPIDLSQAGQGATLPLPTVTGTASSFIYTMESGLPGSANPGGVLGISGDGTNGADLSGAGSSGGAGAGDGLGSLIAVFNPYDVDCECSMYGAQARVNMFDIPIIVNLVLTESYVGAPVLMNYPINRTDFRLIRGVPNVIQFFIRDIDRQYVTTPLANATLTINIVDTNAQKLLLERDLCVVNSATSLYSLSTQPTDMLYWPSGYLAYSVLVTRSDGTQSLLWTDRDYSPYGFIHMTDGPLPGPVKPIILDPSTFYPDTGYNYSSPVPGTASYGYPNGLQTFSIYTTNFTGNVIIQATLVEQPSTSVQDWFPVTVATFSMSNGVTAVNVEGNFLWLRVAVPNHNPVPYPGLPPIYSNGTVDKITFLN